MATIKRAVEYEKTGADPDRIAPGHRGAGARLLEPQPLYDRSDDNEKVIKGRSNARVCFTNDGFGLGSGLGHEHYAACIDVVVGLGGRTGTVNEDGEALVAARNPGGVRSTPSAGDAGRLYITQKGNVDDSFGLATGPDGPTRYRSAIVQKADAVRLISRDGGINLITRTEPINSHDGTIEKVKGINLIAGNDDSNLQPMVLGNALVNVLDDIYSWISKLNGILDGMHLENMKMNAALAAHVHDVVPGPIPGSLMTIPDVKILGPVCIDTGITNTKKAIDIKLHRAKGEFSKMNNLKPWGRGYILSRYNKTN